ncbi:non-ribosomal peptide synthetase [Streptomyces sp. NRRL F-5135]|uniref:non-ribosomal peptide synthetase n=1 Tax=Streptomyces sp. NRRL F-5135 TaxID=1463858 RepID=UPI0004C9D74D|nr:non-ribosomal peptide synthetase [Streptomyces sp. NRRL F-5135]
MAEEISLSAEQRKLVLYHRLYPGDTAFTLAHAERVRGDFDAERLRDALEYILSESVGLNLVFRQGPDGDVGHRHPGRPVVRILDAPGGPDAASEAAAVAAETGRTADRPRTPDEWPLYEVTLYRGRHAGYLSVVCTHLVSDAITMFNIAEMASQLYRDQRLSPDYLAGLRYQPVNTMSPHRTAAAVSAYRELLSGVSRLSHDELSEKRRADGALPGVVRQIALPPDLDAALRSSELTVQSGAYTFFLAAHAVVVSALTGRPDVVVGVPMATRRNWQQMFALGYFINTLPLALDLDGVPTFADLCDLVSVRIRTMLRHKLLDLTEHAPQVFEGRRTPSLQMDNAITHYRKAYPLDLPGCTTDTLFVPRSLVRYPLAVNVREGEGGFTLGVEYTARLAPADPAAMLVNVLRAAVADPLVPLSAMAVLDPEADRGLDELVNDYRAQDKPESVDAWFSATAREHAERTAVTDSTGAWTYAELDGAVSRVADALDRGGHGAHVAVAMPRGRELVAVLLGVLRSGRTYLPLDPNAPAGRLRHILGQFDSITLVAGAALPDAVVGRRLSPAELLEAAPGPRDRPDRYGPREERAAGRGPSAEDVAYIIFTSGSTGVPKGVEVTHHNVTRLFAAASEHYDFDENDVWCLFHSYAFDFAVWEMLGALLHGGRLVVPDDETVRSPVNFARMLVRRGVTVLNQTPSAFRRLTDALDEDLAAGLRVRWVVFGGEALRPGTVGPWTALLGDRARLANMYGITETTVHTTFHEIDPATVDDQDSGVIGKPLADLRISVVDRHLNRCPTGVPGEVLVAGDGVARGYLGRPDLTAERFLTGTPYGDRAYRTGDRAYVRPDGNLVYLDRIDRQVQLRGYRVELGEVETALRGVPGVKDAHVAVHTPDGGEPLLAAWIVADERIPAEAAVRARLLDRLPVYMLPALYVRVGELPLTVNGKVDTGALPAPSGTRNGPAPDPADATTGAVARIWSEVIGRDTVGPDVSFFEAGGNSMHVIQVHRRLTRELRAEGLEVVELFEYPTPRLLAARLNRPDADGALTGGRPGGRTGGRSGGRAVTRRTPPGGDRRRAARATSRNGPASGGGPDRMGADGPDGFGAGANGPDGMGTSGTEREMTGE